jgi:hypothetical protein
MNEEEIKASLMNEEETKELMAAFAEGNKEYSVVTDLGDLYVNLLRCSRSPDRLYRVQAAESLRAFLNTLALRPETPVMEVVDGASQRVGWQKEPSNEYDRALDRICKAAITYMIEASGYTEGRLLTKRTRELVRQIEYFNSLRGDRR